MEISEPPCYYSKVDGLQGSQLIKAKRFIKLSLVKPLTNNTWFMGALPGNSTNYIVVRNREGSSWGCQCQFNKKTGNTCSHILAVQLYINNKLERGFVSTGAEKLCQPI
jgi:hypothetical protein